MQRFVLAVVALLCAASAALADTEFIGAVPQLDGRIVGGTNTTIDQYPHQISMRYNGRHRCGGSIFSSNIIVSASHCVAGIVGENVTRLSIAAGSTLLSEKNETLQVAKIIMHERYKTFNNDYDVAILVLQGHFNYSKSIQPIELAEKRPPAGTEVVVTGWGTLVENGTIPNQLQNVTVNVVDNTVCRKSYTSLLLTPRMLCAAVPDGGKDACQGDSGGPLIVGNQLLGVVSWGIGCARKDYPGVYASVPDLRNWIIDTAKAHNETTELPFL